MIRDEGYFKEYPQPIFEASCADHIDTIINHSTPYYGPFLYWLVRCSGARHALEIGVCKAWTSYFLASGVKDNMTRLTGDGHYYGVDISNELPELQRKLREKGLPVTMLEMDSWDIKPETFPLAPSFGVVFIDGWHSEQHLFKEVELTYPMLQGAGRGYMAIHDCYGWVMKPMQKLLKNPKYNWEYIRFFDNYGLAILRKMDGYVEDPDTMWPQGPQENIHPEENVTA